MFGSKVDAAAKAHAIKQYPNECCGVVVDGAYIPLDNVAADPSNNFQLPASAPVEYQAVVHSHCAPAHVRQPSGNDLKGQIETAVPWGIVLTDGIECTDILWWGDHRLDDRLIGASYIWGVSDCWSVIRRWHWQVRKVIVPDFARDFDEFRSGEGLFLRHVEAAGLAPIAQRDATDGDVVFMQIRGSVPNHCGVICERDLLLHHLPGRLSCREPASRWSRLITHYFRFQP